MPLRVWRAKTRDTTISLSLSVVCNILDADDDENTARERSRRFCFPPPIPANTLAYPTGRAFTVEMMNTALSSRPHVSPRKTEENN